MISIATGSKQRLSEAPAVITVITAADIKAIGATDLDEALETVPGLHVARSNLGYNPIYTIRGVYSDFNPQVLVLINGIPITNLFQGDRNLIWGGMPVEAIARIEVIRGPGSAVYGADAFAGVVNIITKTKQDISGSELGVRGGSFDTWDAWGVHGGTWAGFDVAAMVEFHDTDGQAEIIDADAQTALDATFGTGASLAPGPVNLQRENLDARLDVARRDWRLRAGLQRRRDVGNGAGVAQALDPNNRFASDRWNIDLSYDNPIFAKDWDVTAQVSYLDTSQEIDQDAILFPPGANLGFGVFPDGVIGNPEVFERHARVNLSAFYTGFDQHLFRLGAGFNYGTLREVRETKNFGLDPTTGVPLPPGSPPVDVTDTPLVFIREGDRKNYFLFLQDAWAFQRDWELTAGARFDQYSDFGNTVNPRFALVWQTRDDLTTKLLYGQAFRAPSFAESRNINNPVVLGNPNLDPETIRTVELAFDYQAMRNLRVGLNVFRYWWDDIIRFVPDPGATSRTAQNSGQQTGTGLELEADWEPLDSLRLLGNYAYQESTDEATDRDAGNAPHHKLYVRSEWEFLPDWRVSPQFNCVIDRKRAPGDSRPHISDYSTVDVTIRRKRIVDDWGVAFSVRNLFDSDAREPSPGAAIPKDLPLAGRSVYGEIRLEF
ncbi:MAG: TonB-dependent receptor [Pseudomonadota bacterium]|nr:TonB-dependent receptor [Pseudomonadota bacterium]